MIDLHHGDCISKMKSLTDKSVDLIVTDPPYLMDFQSGMRTATPQFDKIAGDLDGHDLIKQYFFECERILKDDTHIYSFCSWHHINFFKEQFEKYFTLSNILVWNKPGGGMGDLEGSYQPSHEFILFGHKGRRHLTGKRTPDVIRHCKVTASTMVHPTEKPVTLIEEFILASSKKGDVVFEGFMGAGSHGMAAVRNERSFIGCELHDTYFKIAEERIETASCTLENFFQ